MAAQAEPGLQASLESKEVSHSFAGPTRYEGGRLPVYIRRGARFGGMEMAGENRPGRTTWRLYQFIVLWLAVRFAWALLVPGEEWALPPAHTLTMAIDLLLLVAAVGLRTGLFDTAADPRRQRANLLLAAATVCGLGLLGIRFTSEAAWWTGHLRNNGFF